MRPLKGKELFNKDKQFIAFYDADDEFYVESFESIRELCMYKHLPLTKKNLDILYIELVNALRRNPSTTRMLDGTLMHVHLINNDDDEPVEDEII